MLLSEPSFDQPEVAPIRALARKLQQHLELTAIDRAALQRALSARMQRLENGVPLLEQGEAVSSIHVLIDGWACRIRRTPDGRRHIVALYVPGDVCDFGAFLVRSMDSSVIAVGDLRVAEVSRASLSTLIHDHPRIAQGLWWESLVNGSIQREWTLRNGQQNAKRRIAGLVCELAARLYVVGLADDVGFAIPLSQADLGKACGMTPEHTSRTLRELREQGLMTFAKGRITFENWDGLMALAEFDPGYLHFRQLEVETPEPAQPVPVATLAVGWE